MNFNDLETINSINDFDIDNDRIVVEKYGTTYSTSARQLIERVDTTYREISKTSWVFLGPDHVFDILNGRINVAIGQTITRSIKVAGFTDINVPSFCRRLLMVADAQYLSLFTKYRGFYRLIFTAEPRKKILFVLENVQDMLTTQLFEAQSLTSSNDGAIDFHNKIHDKKGSHRKSERGPMTKKGKIPTSVYHSNLEQANHVTLDFKTPFSNVAGFIDTIKILAWSY
jgi:hypothetical protein